MVICCKQLLKYCIVISNYLKTAWRHIMRHKVYTAINIMGLALGICGCLVIYLITMVFTVADSKIFSPEKSTRRIGFVSFEKNVRVDCP